MNFLFYVRRQHCTGMYFKTCSGTIAIHIIYSARQPATTAAALTCFMLPGHLYAGANNL